MSTPLNKDIVFRIYMLYGVMVLVAAAIIFRITQIQFVQGDFWKEKAKEQSYKYFEVKAVRGNIYSDNYSLLATSVPIYDLYWDSKVINKKYFYQKLDSLSIAYSTIFPDESASFFKARLKNAYEQKKRYYQIRKRVGFSELRQLEKLPIFNLGKYKGGLVTENSDYRKRPYQLLAQRTIGNYNTSTQSYEVGIEGAYDDILKGTDGIRIKQKTSGGWRPMYLYDETVTEPIDGIDVISTIDIDLQDVAENSLYTELVKNKADWGCVILMEVKTGKIKAIANLKSDKLTGEYYEGFNYAIGSAVEPGSTFKLASMMVALDDGKVQPNDIIKTGNGEYTYFGKTIKDSHSGGFGDLTAAQVLENSSNVGVFKIILNGYEKNPEQFISKIYKIGINQPIGLDIKGEANPYIKNTSDKTWSKLSLPWMSIGYELKLTPMQILTFYNSVANNGVMIKPIFVDKLSKTGIVQKSFETKVINPKVCSDRTLKILQNMLEGVVQHGTGVMLKNSPFPVAGKTGTAQIYTDSYNKKNYQASFVGYFPADNPKYSCIVVINNPTSGQYYASTVAVPVFKDIADKIYATDLSIQSHTATDTTFEAPSSKVGLCNDIEYFYNALGFKQNNSFDGANFVSAEPKGDILNFLQRKIESGVMPNVKNMSAKDAIYILEDAGLNVKAEGFGKVTTQSIEAGTKISNGEVVKIKLEF